MLSIMKPWSKRYASSSCNDHNTLTNEVSDQAFEKCVVRQWNLSYECLTGMEARSRLRKLEVSDPEFYAELTMSQYNKITPPENISQPEDIVNETEEDEDDCDVPIRVVIEAMTEKDVRKGFVAGESGAIISICNAEEFEGEVAVDDREEELGRGKRQRHPNTRYSSGNFW